MRKILFFCTFLILTSINFGQNIWDVYKKVEKKLKNDSKYLDLYSINFTPNIDELPYFQNVPLAFNKGTFSFDGETSYSVVFIKETVEIDSVLLLYVYTIKTSGGDSDSNSLIATANTTKIDTVKVLSYADIQELYFNPSTRKHYDELYRVVVATIQEQEPRSLLGIDVSKELKKSKGYSSSDNTDFLNYMYVNSIHKYPPLKSQTVVRRRGRVKEENIGTEFQIDASLSHCTFTHKMLEFPFYSLSGEVNTCDDFLNLVPYQNMTINGGIRGLISFSGDEQNLKKDLVLDVRILGKAKVNFSNISHKLPFVFADAAKLNVNSGVILDIKTTQFYNFPFVNLYLSTGSKNYESPNVVFGKRDSSYSFFTSTQWRFLFSFFWNASERADLRLKMDVGLGAHDVIEVIKYKRQIIQNQLNNKIKPIVAFNLAFVPKGDELLNLSLRYYDSIIKGDVWFKLLEIPPHVFRLGGVFISSPLFRNVQKWENEGSGMIQIHYRYGL